MNSDRNIKFRTVLFSQRLARAHSNEFWIWGNVDEHHRKICIFGIVIFASSYFWISISDLCAYAFPTHALNAYLNELRYGRNEITLLQTAIRFAQEHDDNNDM